MEFDKMTAAFPRAFAILLLVVGLSGCAGKKSLEPSVKQQVATLPSAQADEFGALYKVGPLDVLSFKVFREPELTNEALEVDAAGYVYIPLIGGVQAAGKTVRQLTDEIANQLDRRYIVDPQVTIAVQDSYGDKVTVDGEVKKSGIYPIKGNMSLQQVIAMSEGTSEFAKTDEVLIFRVIDGTPSVARFDLDAVRSGSAEDPAIQGGDVVVVGYSSTRRFLKDGLTVFPTLAGIFISLLVNN
jgi:polysaccharide biosynthesis/export protein